jgi:hypothetical protein
VVPLIELIAQSADGTHSQRLIINADFIVSMYDIMHPTEKGPRSFISVQYGSEVQKYRINETVEDIQAKIRMVEHYNQPANVRDQVAWREGNITVTPQ